MRVKSKWINRIRSIKNINVTNSFIKSHVPVLDLESQVSILTIFYSHSIYFPAGKTVSLEWKKEGGVRARRTGGRGMEQLPVGKGWLKLWIHTSWHRWTSVHFSNWRMRWALRRWDPTQQGHTVNMFDTEWHVEHAEGRSHPLIRGLRGHIEGQVRFRLGCSQRSEYPSLIRKAPASVAVLLVQVRWNQQTVYQRTFSRRTHS